MAKICAISGSPRKNGNTEKMIKYIANNNEYELVRLYDSNIKPCTACEGCSKTGKCVIKDDMLEIMKKVEESEILILGSPIYWWNVTAPFKAFMDRWYSKDVRTVIASKKIVIALPMADSDDATAKWAVGSLKDSLEYLGATVLDILVAKGVWEKEDLDNQKDLIKKLESIL